MGLLQDTPPGAIDKSLRWLVRNQPAAFLRDGTGVSGWRRPKYRM